MPPLSPKTNQSRALQCLEHSLAVAGSSGSLAHAWALELRHNAPHEAKAVGPVPSAASERAVGQAWARASQGRALFVMVEKTMQGLDVAAQLRRALAP